MAEMIGDPRPNDDRVAARVEEWKRRVMAIQDVPEDIAVRGLARHVIGQDEAVQAMAVLLRQHIKRLQSAISDNTWTLPTPGIRETRPTLLIGPSGSGKTLLATRAARLAGLPYACHDLTSMTATGWVGMSANDLLTALITRAEGQFPIARHGLLFLDEVDKLRSRETVGVDVGGQGAQRCLLALLDGGQVEIEWPPTRPRDGRAWHPFSCARLLTILAGAFAGLDEIIAKRVGAKRRLGFAADGTREPAARQDLLCRVTEDDLIEYGMIPELSARLNLVVMRDLSGDALRDILLKSADGPLAVQQRMAEREGYHLRLKDDLVEAMVESAMARGLGARPLHAMLAQACRRAAYEVPSRVNALAEGRYTVELGVEALVDGSYGLSFRRRSKRVAAKSAGDAESDEGAPAGPAVDLGETVAAG